MNPAEKEEFEKAFDEMLSHFKEFSEINNSNTAVNNMRRKTNTQLEMELKGFSVFYTNKFLENREQEIIKRVVEELEDKIFCAYDTHSFLKNIDGTQYLNENMLFDLLSSIEDTNK